VTIQLTPTAAQRIGRQLSQRGKGIGLRVGVRKAGCSGYAYTMDYADEVLPGEQVFEQHGARVLVSDEHLPLLAGLTLDFRKEGLSEAFRFVNPNAKGQCGCGESFTV
jgi:iron-sulfur cluster assembly protein